MSVKVSDGIEIKGNRYWADKLPQMIPRVGIYQKFKYM